MSNMDENKSVGKTNINWLILVNSNFHRFPLFIRLYKHLVLA